MSPTQAFLCSMDQAIQATFQCLNEAGVDQEIIWSALRQSLRELQSAVAATEEGELAQVPPLPRDTAGRPGRRIALAG